MITEKSSTMPLSPIWDMALVAAGVSLTALAIVVAVTSAIRAKADRVAKAADLDAHLNVLTGQVEELSKQADRADALVLRFGG